MTLSDKCTFVKSVQIGEEELEVWRTPEGNLVGIDAIFLDQVSDEVCDPYNESLFLWLPDHELDGGLVSKGEKR